MKYYKVKPEAGQKDRGDGTIYIANELYTEKEKERLSLKEEFLELIEVSKRNVYFFFGARFAKQSKN